MLTQAELTGALHAALKSCTPACKPWCVVGAEVTEDGRYRIWHNGTGARDTNAQTIYADATLGFAQAGLSHKLRTWLEGCHLGLPVDLNAAMTATGGPVEAGGAYIVGERGPELFTPAAPGRIVSNQTLRGPAMRGFGWPHVEADYSRLFRGLNKTGWRVQITDHVPSKTGRRPGADIDCGPQHIGHCSSN